MRRRGVRNSLSLSLSLAHCVSVLVRHRPGRRRSTLNGTSRGGDEKCTLERARLPTARVSTCDFLASLGQFFFHKKSKINTRLRV